MQGIITALGFNGPVTSPTFTLSRDYPVRDKLIVHHFDMYRLAGHDIVTDELEEVALDPQAITLVEWAQHGSVKLAADRLRISLSYGQDETRREITIAATGPISTVIVEAL